MSKVVTKDTLKKKLVARGITKLVLYETAGLLITYPVLFGQMKPALMKNVVTKDNINTDYIDRNYANSFENELQVKSSWTQKDNGEYMRYIVKYDMDDKTDEEIKNLVNNEDALLNYIIEESGERSIEEKKSLTNSELENNAPYVEAHIYEYDENYKVLVDGTPFTKCLSLLALASLAGLSMSNITGENYSTHKNMLDSLTDEEVLESKGSLSKALKIVRKKH